MIGAGVNIWSLSAQLAEVLQTIPYNASGTLLTGATLSRGAWPALLTATANYGGSSVAITVTSANGLEATITENVVGSWAAMMAGMLPGQTVPVAVNNINVSPAPSMTVAPVITGTPTVGSTLTCSQGTWANANSYAYQWFRNGIIILGATASTYALAAGDSGRAVSCRVTATGAGGSLAAVAAPVFVAVQTDSLARNGGTGYLLRNSGLGDASPNALLADSERWTFAFRALLPTSAIGVTQRVFQMFGRGYVQINSDGRLEAWVYNTANTLIGRFQSTSSIAHATERVFVVSVNATAGQLSGQVTADGVAIPGSWVTALTAGTIDHTRTAMAFLGTTTGTSIVHADTRWRWFYYSGTVAKDPTLFGTAASNVDPSTIGDAQVLFNSAAAIVAGDNTGTPQGGGDINFTPSGTGLAVETTGASKATIAFPDAIGAGATALGAYATTDTPEVRWVTNRNNSGAGSFRDAVSTDTPALVLLNVGGQISISGEVQIRSNKTVIGEHAPEYVTFRSASVTPEAGGNDRICIRGSQVILTGIAVRPGTDWDADSIQINGYGVKPTNVLVAYCSGCWTGDEFGGAWNGAEFVTYQHCLFFESIDRTVENLGFYFGSTLLQAQGFQCDRVDFIRNAVMTVHYRMLGFRNIYRSVIAESLFYNWGGNNYGVVIYDDDYFDYTAGEGSGGIYSRTIPNKPAKVRVGGTLLTEVANSAALVSNGQWCYEAGALKVRWGSVPTNVTLSMADPPTLDVINNHFTPGPWATVGGWTTEIGRIEEPANIYMSGNTLSGVAATSSEWTQKYGAEPSTFPGSRVIADGYSPTLVTKTAVEGEVLGKAGSRRNGQPDSIDARAIALYQSNTAWNGSNKSSLTYTDFDDYEPTLGLAPRTDTDSNGIVDAYETAIGVPIGSILPHAIIDAVAQGLDARWNGHRHIMHQAHWMRTGGIV